MTHQAGFGVVNTVLCGQLLSGVSDYRITMDVGMIIIAGTTYFVSLFGFRLIQSFEKYSWIMTFVVLCVLIRQTVPLTGHSQPTHLIHQELLDQFYPSYQSPSLRLVVGLRSSQTTTATTRSELRLGNFRFLPFGESVFLQSLQQLLARASVC